jgi:hypothetical protein
VTHLAGPCMVQETLELTRSEVMQFDIFILAQGVFSGSSCVFTAFGIFVALFANWAG